MRDKDKNRDPLRAQRRAINDFRCASNKLQELHRSLGYTYEADRLKDATEHHLEKAKSSLLERDRRANHITVDEFLDALAGTNTNLE